MDNRAIGVFDSGVGGMTVLRELKRELPTENYIYIGDTASFPYGSKSKNKIIELTKKQIENLIDLDVKLIIIACGTATSQALDEMKKIFNIPIIGIIEPTLKYIKSKHIKDIGVIATTGTIRSGGWQNEIEKNIENAKVQNKACPMLAPMAEEGWVDNEIAKLAVHEYLKDMKDIEALILGCTHYPLFKNLIRKELGDGIEIINTGDMVAEEVKEYIKNNNLEHMLPKKEKSNLQIYLTDLECNFINVAKKLINDDEISISKIN